MRATAGAAITAKPSPEQPGGPTRADLVSLLRRRLPLFVACVVLAPAAAVAGALTGPEPDYRASASLLYRPLPLDEELFPSLTPENPQTPRDTRAITEAVVAADVASQLPGGLDASAIDERVTTSVREGEDLVHVSISATDPDRSRATSLANAYADAYARLRADIDTRRLRNALLSLRDNLRDRPEPAGERALREQLADLRELHELRQAQTRSVERAASATRESRRVGRKASIGLALGLLLALASTFLLEQLDRRIRSRFEAERIFGAPALDVSAALERVWTAAGGGRVAVASSDGAPASGRLASRLAAAAGAAGYDVELVDAGTGTLPGGDTAGVLAAVVLGRTQRADAEALQARLAAQPVPVLGVVIDP